MNKFKLTQDMQALFEHYRMELSEALYGSKILHNTFGEGKIADVVKIAHNISEDCFDANIVAKFGQERKELRLFYMFENGIASISDADLETLKSVRAKLQQVKEDIELKEREDAERIAAINAKVEAERAALVEEGKKRKKKKAEDEE